MISEPRVEAGAVTVLRLYDVAYAIDLAAAERLAGAETAAVARVRLARAEPKAIDFGIPPVEIGLGPVELGAEMATAHARVYDFGAVSLLLRVPIAGVPWTEFVDRSNAVDRAAQESPAWVELLERLRGVIGPALERPTPDAALEEDYLLAGVRRFEPPLGAADVLGGLDLAPLLSGERRELSEASRRELLRHAFSYYTTDLVVLTWDHAFILEPSGDTDVADVLEVANAQLLELRYYDELLDAELPRMYDRVEAARRGWAGLARRRYADLARQLYTLVAEVTEITERVDNALKVTEDVYLARIYGSALELFRVPTLSAAVNRKLAIIRDTYTALYDEAATARAEILELGIFILIILELVLALL
ncbi:MAG TPA: hypothetical protein VFQ38_02520 [Longimicrobiales bacterium]|nr:hypothetical protein [Longimicrobiales bacterium]